MNLTLKQYLEDVKNNTLDPQKVLQHYVNKAKNNDSYHAFLRINETNNQKNLENTPLLGAPIALKDNIMLEGVIASCGSKMLEKYTAPYTATCAKNLQDNGANLIWMTNMDEFAMGSTTATSYFGITLNPHGNNRLPGGSSWGSAAAVAWDLCLGALGSDTGGSVRQPASRCGIVGLKPTYGRISRYGVQAMASSLDQIGIFAKTVEDCKIILENTMGYDTHDAQSQTKADEKIERNNKPLNEYKIAIPNTLLWEGLDPKIKTRFLEIIEQLKNKWNKIDYIDIPILEQLVSMYYIIQPAETSTNLARFDGIRFGLQKDTKDFNGIMDYITAIRSEGFGEEVKRRIMLGTFVLSSANYEGFYLKATQARKQLISEFEKVYKEYDLILSPTTPTVAWKVGENSEDPLKAYLADLYTIPANMAGLPAISVPIWTVEDQGDQMPVGLQIMGKQRDESSVLSFTREIETLTKH